MEKGGEVSFQLVEPREDTAIVFQKTEETLDLVPLFVKLPVVRPLFQPVIAERNMGLGILLNDKIPDIVAVIPFIGEQFLKRHSFYQRNGLRRVVALSGGHDKV